MQRITIVTMVGLLFLRVILKNEQKDENDRIILVLEATEFELKRVTE